MLRRILDLPAPSPLVATKPPLLTPVAATLTEFIRSERFQGHHQAIDRYLVILGWLHSAHSKQFVEAALKFHRGIRAYFAKSEKEILESGDGVTARQIPQSPLWTLTTLDNKSKRLVLEDVLRVLGYPRSDINLVLAVLPDSGIRRSHGSARLFDSITSRT